MIDKGLGTDDARSVTPQPDSDTQVSVLRQPRLTAGDAPQTMLIMYRAPAILASWRGEAPVRESTSRFPQLVEFRGRGWLA
jgi:hypothetical protein